MDKMRPYALLIEVNHFFYSIISEGFVLCLLVDFRGRRGKAVISLSWLESFIQLQFIHGAYKDGKD